MLEIKSLWYPKGFIGIQRSPIGTPRISVRTPRKPPRKVLHVDISLIVKKMFSTPG